MDQETKNEALEQLKKDILFGFEDKEELFDSISEMFYEEDSFNRDWLRSEINKQFESHLLESKKWNKPTDFEKLVVVFDQLNREGIVSLHNAGYTRQDAEGDCLDVIEDLKKINIQAKGYCYYHAQDLERAIQVNGMLYLGYDSFDSSDSLAKEIAERVIEVLSENGFETAWSGSLDARIEIKKINWQKAYDGSDYGYGRSYDIIKSNHQNNHSTKRKSFWKFW